MFKKSSGRSGSDSRNLSVAGEAEPNARTYPNKKHLSAVMTKVPNREKSWRIMRTVLKKSFSVSAGLVVCTAVAIGKRTYRLTTAPEFDVNSNGHHNRNFLGDSSMVRSMSRRVNVSSHRYARMMQTRHGMAQRFGEDQRSISRFRQGRAF